MQISELKSRAKNVLSNSYWISFGATIIFTMLCMACSGSMYLFLNSVFGTEAFGDIETMSSAALAGIMTWFCIILVIGSALSLFVAIPLMIGHNSFYLKASNNDVNLMYLFDAFKYKYFNIIKIMFLYYLYISLWSFLALIPIIAIKICFPNIDENFLMFLSYITSVIPLIKQMQYFMIEYIVADNPEITAKRAFEITKSATKGYKFSIFLLHLSFIGWVLLGMIACFIGTYFVMPYFYATRLQCYKFLKENAIKNGFATHADFNTDALRGYIL